MGRYLTPISKHNLDLSSLANLANDLSQRLEINIEYGYYNHADLGKLYSTNSHNKFNVLGTALFAPKAEAFYLTDLRFLERELYKLMGRSFFSSKAYLHAHDKTSITETEIDKRIADVENSYIELWYSNDENRIAIIYKECLNCEFFSFSRWGVFLDAVLEKSYNCEEEVKSFRRNMKHTVQKTGGDKVFYVRDECEKLGGIGQTGEGELPWEEVESIICKQFGDNLIDLSRFHTDEAYRNTVKAIDKNEIIFVDDFSDL